ncbi:MAG TPA: M50 family metallopeptidase [Candidatus Saccharimonadales bacterium]|nr:M50 family metallopeptidase [Candidatus Saccharimonadales bacterium]
MSALLLIIGIVLFILLVVVHEFGHFIVARRNGVEVEEFGIFFPPRLFKHKTKAGWLFSINALPLGGFVKLKGEHDTDTEPGSFGAASLWVKSKIMAAGVVMNLVTALVMLTALAWIGMPKLLPNQFTVKNDTRVIKSSLVIAAIEPGSPAAKAGLKVDDKLLAVGPVGHLQVVSSAAALPDITKQYAGQKVQISLLRQGSQRLVTTTLRNQKTVEKSNQPHGYLGIVPSEFKLQRSTWSAPIVAVGLAGQVSSLTFQGLGHALAGLGSLLAGLATGNHTARQNGQAVASSQVAGPVGIFVVLKDGTLLGYEFVLFIIAIISLTLAIMNILPIPALDGGRLWITLVARSLKKPLSARTEELVNATGFLLLIGLVILITILDVKRFF